MKNCCGMILSSLIPLACPAAEIVAWKVPLWSYAEAGLSAEGIIRCKEAPEPSLFIRPGDELWDLKDLNPQQNPEVIRSPEWIVWNATSGRLIAKAGWSEIVKIHQLLQPEKSSPARCRMKLEVFEVAVTGGPLTENAVPLAEVTFFTPSSQKVSGEWGVPGKSIQYVADTSFDVATTSVDTHLDMTVKVPGQADLAVKTFVRLMDKPLWIARDSDGKSGIDIRASAIIELLDGTPVDERILIRKGDQAVALPVRGKDIGPVRVEGRGWITTVSVTPSVMESYLRNPAEVAGPATKVADRTIQPPMPDARAIPPPGFLRPWLDHEVLDARDWFKEIMPFIKGGDDFVGYDPLQERFYFYSTQQTSVENVRNFFNTLKDHDHDLIVVFIEGRGQTRLVGLNGNLASLERKPLKRSVEIEPLLSGSREIVDLRFFYEDLADSQRECKINSNSTLTVGKFLELIAGKAGEESSSLRVRAEVIPMNGK